MITPKNVIDNSIDNSLVRSIHFLPFDEKQREQFIINFAKNGSENIWNWNVDQFKSTLNENESLKELAKEPLTLFMILRILPRLSETSTSNQRLDPSTLTVVSVSNSNSTLSPKLLRCELYAIFLEDWMQRESKRSSPNPKFVKAIKFGVEETARKLAFEMFSNDKTSVNVPQQ